MPLTLGLHFFLISPPSVHIPALQSTNFSLQHELQLCVDDLPSSLLAPNAVVTDIDNTSLASMTLVLTNAGYQSENVTFNVSGLGLSLASSETGESSAGVVPVFTRTYTFSPTGMEAAASAYQQVRTHPSVHGNTPLPPCSLPLLPPPPARK